MAQEIAMPLTFTAVDDAVTLRLFLASGINTECVEYVETSIDGGRTWIRTENQNNQQVIISVPLQRGESVAFRGLANRYYNPNTSANFYSHFDTTGLGYINANGNIMSLLNPNFKDLISLNSYAFSRLFESCIKLKTVPLLPATNLAQSCYQSMFYGCGNITVPPILPATRLVKACYARMFIGTGLLTAPKLHAVEIAESCYYYMFSNCSNIITPPTLPATTLEQSCYEGMFYDCQGLIVAPLLPATTLKRWCYNAMFKNCVSLKSSPVLRAKDLPDGVYDQMFYGCTSLNEITMLAESKQLTSLQSWVYNVAATGTFKKSPNMTTLPTGSSGIPANWTVEDYIE